MTGWRVESAGPGRRPASAPVEVTTLIAPRGWADPAAFTLLEVLIVLALYSMILVFVIGPTLLLIQRPQIEQALFTRAQGVAERGIDAAQAQPCAWASQEETVSDEGRDFTRIVTVGLVAETLVRYHATVRWSAFGRQRQVVLMAYQQVQALPYCPAWVGGSRIGVIFHV